MARNKTNILARGFSGGVGKQFVLRTKGERTILANRPSINPNRIATPDQEAVQLKFRESVIYAKTAIQDPALKLDYAAVARPGQSAFNVAFSDAYLAPELSNLDTNGYSGTIGDRITVRAIDNFFVESVKISILAAGGVLLEEGNAVLGTNGLDWTYTVTQANAALAGTTIRVAAEDLPKNRTILEKIL